MCRVPFDVGIQAFDAIDLRREFSRLGLPQFCDAPGRRTLGPPLIVEAEVPRQINGGERLMFAPAITHVDMLCASIEHPQPGVSLLVTRINQYAARILQDAADRPKRARVCRESMELRDESADHALLTFLLSGDSATAKRETDCIATAIALQASCRQH